jgi:hypothetical protein
MNRYDRENIGNLVAGEGDWFTAKLLRLIAKADASNRERLRLGFPDEVAAYDAWAHGPYLTGSDGHDNELGISEESTGA